MKRAHQDVALDTVSACWLLQLPNDLHNVLLTKGNGLKLLELHTLRFTCKKLHTLVLEKCKNDAHIAGWFWLYWRQPILVTMARNGYLNLMKWSVTLKSQHGWDELNQDTDVTVEEMEAANGESVPEAAAKTGQVAILEWLENKGLSVGLIDEKVCECAARYGQLRVLEWFKNKVNPWYWDNVACKSAVCFHAAKGDWETKKGHLEILKWLRERGCLWDTDVCSAAARNGDMEMLQWAVTNGCRWNDDVAANAVRHGHLKILEWSVNNGQKLYPGLATNAAKRGHLDILKWVLIHGGERWDELICSEAASGGHLHILEWARAHGLDWNRTTCSEAAEAGHLEILQWARQHGCEWNAGVCSWAAQNGHLDVIKWARENGCQWDADTIKKAIKGGWLHVLEYAFENGCPYDGEYLARVLLANKMDAYLLNNDLTSEGGRMMEEMIRSFRIKKGYKDLT